MIWRGVLMVVVLVAVIADRSDASLLTQFKKLARNRKNVVPIQDSPSPSPIPSINSTAGHLNGSLGTAGAPVPAPVPSYPTKVDQGGGNSHEACKGAKMNCHNQNLTACVVHPASAPTKLVLLVYNDGEGILEVNVTISPVNNTLKEIHRPKIQIAKHEMGKMDVSKYAGSPLITLNRDCLIHMASPPQSYSDFLKQFGSFPTQVTPIHGVYLLSLTALIVGGTWACCKLGKKERKVDGVPYQELEMGQPDPSAIHVETAEGWDQGWDDDDWDLENAVRTPGGNNVANGSANGHTTKSSNRDGWEDDWDD